MTPKEFAHATMLVASLRTRLAHANALTAAVTTERDDLAKQLAAHVESLKLSNTQCGEYLLHNEMLAADRATLHKELVEVRAALASVSAERDSFKRTLDEWSNAETKPHARVDAEDMADHVVPPLPMCTTCHGCGGKLLTTDSSVGCYTVGCRRTMTVPVSEEISYPAHPYYGPCPSNAVMRHG